MFILVYSDNELLKSDDTAYTFATHDDARAAMAEQFVESLRREGNEPVLPMDGGDVFDHDVEGLFLGYMYENEAYTDPCEEKWVIFEVPDLPSPKRNPNVAETVRYSCSAMADELLHSADIRWDSAKGGGGHAPAAIELRMGGEVHTYLPA